MPEQFKCKECGHIIMIDYDDIPANAGVKNEMNCEECGEEFTVEWHAEFKVIQKGKEIEPE